MMSCVRLILLLVCISTVCSAAPRPPVEELIGDLQALREARGVPAIGFTLVDRRRTLYAGALGVADVESRRTADDRTMFRVGSITKAFTALAILVLAEEGRLALDDPVVALADDPPLTNRWAHTHPVRVAHLLEHTAGFRDLSREEFDFNEPVSLATALALRPESRTTWWKPGQHASYSNSGAGVAAWLLERLSGESYEAFVERRLFSPLGMDSAGFFLDPPTRERLATGYQADGRTVIPYWNMIFRAFGAINVTPADMAPFLKLLLNHGCAGELRLLPATAIERMERPETTLAARDGLVYGYGLGNYYWTHRGFIFHGHGGDGDGYLAHYGYNRDADLAYFLVINEFDHEPLRTMRELVEDYIIAGLTPPEEPPLARLTPQQLRALSGIYARATQRFPSERGSTQRLVVEAAEDRLYTRIDAAPRRELLPVTARHFRRPGQPMATAAFVQDEDGALILQGEMGNWQRVETVGVP